MSLRTAVALFCGAILMMASRPAHAAITIISSTNATPREQYGISRLREATEHLEGAVPPGAKILVGIRTSVLFVSMPALPRFLPSETEAYHIERSENDWLVIGSDSSGVLYGCLELARRIQAAHALPPVIDLTDKPAFKLRGTCLLLMKYGNGWYNWPVTPANFPWFYDRKLMLQYLDELAENRYNMIVFWNAHPFPYFLTLPKYPEARMLDDADLQRNMDQLRWFTEEADRRGIWTVVEFYNIHVSPNFAKAHEREGVKIENAASTPLLEAYTRYCISEFVKAYSNVGIMITAGESLQVRKEEFVRDAIIPGLKDSGKNPPLIVRQWTIDPIRYRDIIRSAYDNLYTMMKHNTEMLVSPYPDPRNKTWVSYGRHIINVHENADVKPFRWASPRFVQQMTQQWKEMGVAGFQVYPMVSWQWPTSLDRADPPLNTISRDRMWIEEFGRYGWNPIRPVVEEERFWTEKLSRQFGSAQAGKAIYNYYVKTAPVLPNIQNVLNIFNMNFFPTAVGQDATLNGILHSDRWEGVGDYQARPLDDVSLAAYESEFGPLSDTALKRPPLSVKEWVAFQRSGEKAEAIDPTKLAAVNVNLAQQALSGLESARDSVTLQANEYSRFITDAQCILYLAQFYRSKIEAATEKGLFDGTNDAQHYTRMLQLLASSVTDYSRLDTTATKAYRQPTDLVPYYHWHTVLENFQRELAFYQEQATIGQHGANIVYLGLDGPMSDATNEFHWLLEDARKSARLSAQSYDFQPTLFSNARLVVVYDAHSPEYVKNRAQLDQWVRNGGKVLFWDPMAHADGDPLLSGIQFAEQANFGSSTSLYFQEDGSQLLNGLAGTTLELDNGLSSNIRSASQDWQMLAYTVLPSISDKQFYVSFPTFGPRWTSLIDSVRVPVLLKRGYGSGTVVIAQIGRWTIEPQADMGPVRAEATRSPLGKFVENLIAWAAAEQPPQAAGASPLHESAN